MMSRAEPAVIVRYSEQVLIHIKEKQQTEYSSYTVSSLYL